MTQMLQKLNATLVKPNRELQLRLTPITRTRNEPFMHCYLGKYKPKLPPAWWPLIVLKFQLSFMPSQGCVCLFTVNS